jgi:hypothetical protein
MSAGRFFEFDRAQIAGGGWFEPVRAAWARGEVGLVSVAPEPSGDAELRQAILTMIDSNGSFRRGDRAVIHARPAALTLGCETAWLLRERGIEARVILGMTALGREVDQLARAVYAPREEADFEPSQADPARLDGVYDAYRSLLAPITESGRGHWIVTIGTAPDPERAHVPALDLFSKVAGRALAPIGPLRNEGKLCSHDIWLAPGALDVERLNEQLPAERRWTLEEWRSLVFRAMAVGAEDLRRRARTAPTSPTASRAGRSSWTAGRWATTPWAARRPSPR